MKPVVPSAIELEFASALRAHLLLCEEVMTLNLQENHALQNRPAYQPLEFCQKRKNLLPRLEESLMLLRKWRHRWQQIGPAALAAGTEVKSMFQALQALLMKLLLLDRENQQALLRQGLLPPGQLPPSAGQQPHCVADLYRRHACR